TTPWAQLSVNPTSANGSAPAFAIGSSTATSFVVNNNGRVSMGTTTSVGRLLISGTNINSSYTDGMGSSRNINFGTDFTVTDSAFTNPIQSNSFITNVEFSSDPGVKAVNGGLFTVQTLSTSTALGSMTFRALQPTFTHNGSGALGTALANSGVTTNASTSIMALGIGAQGSIINSFTGTITEAVGVRALTTNSNASGILTSSYGFKVNDISNAGTIGNMYGVHVGDLTTGTQTNTPFSFYASDGASFNYFAGSTGIGTSTLSNIYSSQLTVSSSTNPQLALSAGAGLAQWTLRNAGGNFYLGTTTVAGTSTTTTSALSINGTTGNVGIGNSNSAADLSINGVSAAAAILLQTTSSGLSATDGFELSMSPGAHEGYVWNYEAGPILVGTSNTERLRITSTGTVGIGTSTPWAQLSINPTSANGTAPAFAIGSSTATSFVVTNAGFVGLGTANPQNRLEVSSNDDTSTVGIYGGNVGTYLTFARNNGTVASPSDVTNGTQIGTIEFRGYTNAGYNLGARIISTVDGTPGAQAPANITFQTNPGSGSTLERMRIAATGQIGIGTSTPFGNILTTLASSTNPQLALSAGAGLEQWTLRNAGGSFYLGTTTVEGTSTTTISALEIAGSGFGTTTLRGLNISGFATSTSNVGFNITTGCFAIGGNCIGSGSFTNTLANGGTATTTFYNGGVVFSDGLTLTQASSTSSFFYSSQNNRLGLGTSSPYARLSVVGEIVAANITATSTTATSTISGGLNVGSGAITYDFSTGITSIPNLTIGATSFDADSGIVSWTDMPVTTAATAGTEESYSAQIDGNSILTIFGRSDGSGGLTNYGVGIGTSTPFYGLTLASTTQPQLALSAGAGLAQWTFRNAGGSFYLGTTTVAGTSTSTLSALSINGTSGTTTLWALNVAATGANATSTIEGNLNVKGTLKIGTASVYISESGFNLTNASNFNFSGENNLTSFGFGTSTPLYTLTVSSTTAPQIALSAGTGLAQWTFRNAGGSLYFATTTVAGTSTSTLAALSINGTTGALSLGTTTAGTLKVTSNGTVWSDTSGGGAGYSTVTDDTQGTLTQRSTLSFLGTGINCVDNAGNSSTDCTVNAGAATAAGSDNEIQFNTGDALDSDTGFVWNKTTDRLGLGTSSPVATLSASSTSDTVSTAVFDQRGAGGLLTLQQAGVDKFTVANSGALSIFAVTGDVTKTTTGGTKTTDFDYTGSTLASTTAANGYVTISNGALSNGGTITSTSTQTAVAVGVGGHAVLRTNGQYLIVHGGGSATASVWNGIQGGTMSALATNVVSTGSVGAGSISLKRPDGRYLIVHGGGTTATSVFDPMGITAVTAGPTITGSAATGTAAALLPNGKYLILSGNTTSWGVYDPAAVPASGYTNVSTYITGTPTWGPGTHILQRDDGTFLIYVGGTATTYVYNPYHGINGTMYAGPTAPSTITEGSFSIRRADGLFLTLPGIASQSFLYNPVGTTTTNAMGAFSGNLGVGPTAGLSEGAAQTMWRQDGKYLLITATTSGSVLTTNLLDPGAGLPGASGAQSPSFTTSGVPTMTAGAVGLGMTAMMLPNGQYAIIRGAGQTIDLYDMNFITGVNSANTQDAYYESECIASSTLSPNTTLNWTSNQEGRIQAYARTATSPSLCSSATYRPIGSSGELIGATSTLDNMVQIKFVFQRELPRFVDQEWGLRKGSITRYRRVNGDPTLYDVTIDNGAVLHRSQFDFGNSVSSTTAPASGPAYVNISNDSSRNNALALQSSFFDTTVNATNAAYLNGTSTTHAALTTATASSTVVMKRPDGKWIVIAGNTTPNAMVYDENTQAFTANTTVPTASLGIGGLAFKRPDGKFLIILASGTGSSTTNIYDPVANTFSAGPSLASVTGTTGAGEGASALPLPNGRVLIMHGGGTVVSSIYDPVNNSMSLGPNALSAATTVTTVGAGSLWIPRPDGTYLFLPGMATAMDPTPAGGRCAAVRTTTNIFNPYTMRFTFTGAPAQTAGGTGPGAFAFQRKDGQWIIVKGASNAVTCGAGGLTQLYNPVSNQAMATGPAINGMTGAGGFALPRPDGTWLIVNGFASSTGVTTATTTNIYIEQAQLGTTVTSNGDQGTIGSFINGPAMVTPPNSGSASFQRSDGKFVIITGAATTTTASTVIVYDAGWVANGIYKSEQFDMSPIGSKLNSNSTLVWKSNMGSTPYGGVSAEVRTATTQAALGTSSPVGVVNGGLINPGTNDVWMQINFNFRRTFPSYGGIYEDVWRSNGMSYPVRQVVTPVLYEYKVSQDKDILNLQADGLSVFRVSTNGDVYTQAGGTINTSGADLAERYTSQEKLDFGEVVTIDPMNNHAVKKSKYQYQTDMVGVVSTDPGFISGAYTENSYPIGLIGRVPVKVSTENGMIHAGDYLTTSSVPGHAMKATLAGRVLGKALEGIDPSKMVECPASDLYIPGRKCATVMMFVNLIDYGGQSVETAMSDWKIIRDAKLAKAAFDAGLEYTPIAGNPLATSSPVSSISSRDAEVLEFLTLLKAERAEGVTASSELFADKISAISQVISPEIVAKVVKSERIDGLEINVDRVNTRAITTNTISAPGGLTMSLVDGKLVIRGRRLVAAPLSTTTVSVASTTDVVATTTESIATTTENNLAVAILAVENATTTDLISSTTPEVSTTTAGIVSEEVYVEDAITVSFDTSGNAYFAGEVVANKVSTGGLAVTGVATFANGLEVSSIGNASTTLAILSDTTFFGRPYFTSDTGGSAVIKAGAKTVDVVFDREYVASPVVNASISFGTSTEDSDIEAIFEKDIRFVVTNRSEKGFTIRINKNLTEDVVFNWIALAVTDSKLFTSRTTDIAPIVEGGTGTTTPVVVGGGGNASTTDVTGGGLGDNGTTTPIIIGDETATTTPIVTASTTDSNLNSGAGSPTIAAPVPDPEPVPTVGEPVTETVPEVVVEVPTETPVVNSGE
ncbi:MAG: hypothetical protein AB198_01235, partial [Parcubacteria bacterium C7867-003]